MKSLICKNGDKMKNIPFTTISESQELMKLGFPKWTASCKYIPTGYIKDTLMIVSGNVDQEDQIPSWTVGCLIESLPPIICGKKSAYKLKISLENGCWKVCYGSLFKASHLELKEALLSTIRYVFGKYDIRTRKEVFNLFFKKNQEDVWLSDDEYSFYFRYICERLKELSKTHNILLLYHLVSSRNPREHIGWYARLEVDKDKVGDLLGKYGVIGKSWFSEKDYRMLDPTSDEFINTFVDNRDEGLIIEDKNPIDSEVIIRTE